MSAQEQVGHLAARALEGGRAAWKGLKYLIDDAAGDSIDIVKTVYGALRTPNNYDSEPVDTILRPPPDNLQTATDGGGRPPPTPTPNTNQWFWPFGGIKVKQPQQQRTVTPTPTPTPTATPFLPFVPDEDYGIQSTSVVNYAKQLPKRGDNFLFPGQKIMKDRTTSKMINISLRRMPRVYREPVFN